MPKRYNESSPRFIIRFRYGFVPVTELLKSYATELHSALLRVTSGKARIVVPGTVGLHRRRPGAHFHPTPEFFLQAGGGTDFDCPSGKFRLRTGDLCIIPAGVPHAEKPLDLRTPYRVIVLARHADGFIALEGLKSRAGSIQSGGVRSFAGGGAAFHCLDQASQAGPLHRSLRHDFVRGITAAFLASILSEFRRPEPPADIRGSPLVREAERMVRVEISHTELSVKKVSDRVGCSPDHLTRLFQAEHGMSLGVWIAKERIQLACELLLRPDHNIAEVGWTCGFASPSYFIRVFKAHTGVTPKAWRIQPSGSQSAAVGPLGVQGKEKGGLR